MNGMRVMKTAPRSTTAAMMSARRPRTHSVSSLRKTSRSRGTCRPGADARAVAGPRASGLGGHAATSFWSMSRRKTVSRSSVSSELLMRVRPASTANPVIERWTSAEAPSSVDTSNVVVAPLREVTATDATPASARRPASVVVVGAAEDDPERVLGERAEQDLGRCRLDEPAVVEDRDVVADPLDVVEDVGRIEDRRLALQLAHQVEDVLAADRVERRDRLVEEDDGRAADECLGDPEALAHAARIGRGPPIGGLGDPDPLEQAGRSSARGRASAPWKRAT